MTEEQKKARREAKKAARIARQALRDQLVKSALWKKVQAVKAELDKIEDAEQRLNTARVIGGYLRRQTLSEKERIQKRIDRLLAKKAELEKAS